MVKEIAKLVVVKPVLGSTKKLYLEEWGFTKTNGEWSKEGTVEELKNFWDEIDVYKDKKKFVNKTLTKYMKSPYSGVYYVEQNYRIYNDYELDFYLQVEKIQELEIAA